MSKAYMKTDELDPIIEKLIKEKDYHADLHLTGATIQVLFHYGSEALTLRGVACFAYIEATPTKYRALGLCDATMVVDMTTWEKFDEARKTALVDHELYHLGVKRKRNGDLILDYLKRPKFNMRPHDIEVGWFAKIAEEHKQASIEVMQAGSIVENYRQSIFRFAALPAKHKAKTH